MFDQLSERLQDAFQSLGKKKNLSLENMDDAIKTVRRALLEADMSLRTVKTFIANVKEKAEGEDILKSVSPSQQLTKIVHDELVRTLGETNQPLTIEGNPPLIVLFGLQGFGKTTSAGKLALHLRKKQEATPLLIAADVYRPAAIQQLITLGKQIQVPVHTIEGQNDVLTIVQSGIEHAKAENVSPVIIDTAGRLQVDTDMMAELLLLERMLKPAEKLLVVDAMTGQEAINVAETFNTQLGVTGLVLTKLDGDSRGGAALSVVDATGTPIKFVGTSEKMDGLEPFHPERLATRILGMGDVVSLVEKAAEAIDADEAAKLEEKMRKAQFTIEDFQKMQGMFGKLGSIGGVLGMLPIPGLTKDMKDTISNVGEKEFGKIDAIINSMTIEERRNPELLKHSRPKRIAKGCGKKESDIQQFLKQFNMMKSMMRQFSGMMPGAVGMDAMPHPAGAKGAKQQMGGMNPLLMSHKRKRPLI